MLASYTFNSAYRPIQEEHLSLPGLRLLEGGKFQPGDYAPVIIKQGRSLRLKFFQWNLSSPDAPKREISYISASNALDHKDYYQIIREQRCLVPVDAYYVKSREGQQHKIQLTSEETFCFAGVYRQWKSTEGMVSHTFALLSSQAAPALSQFSLLMPLILRKQDERIWLNAHAHLSYISRLLYQPAIPSLTIAPVYQLMEASDSTYTNPIAA